MWQCVQCTEKVDDSLDVCWNCGTGQDGNRDPSIQGVSDDSDVLGAGRRCDSDGTTPRHSVLLSLPLVLVAICSWGVVSLLGLDGEWDQLAHAYEVIHGWPITFLIRAPTSSRNPFDGSFVEFRTLPFLFDSLLFLFAIFCVGFGLRRMMKWSGSTRFNVRAVFVVMTWAAIYFACLSEYKNPLEQLYITCRHFVFMTFLAVAYVCVELSIQIVECLARGFKRGVELGDRALERCQDEPRDT